MKTRLKLRAPVCTRCGRKFVSPYRWWHPNRAFAHICPVDGRTWDDQVGGWFPHRETIQWSGPLRKERRHRGVTIDWTHSEPRDTVNPVTDAQLARALNALLALWVGSHGYDWNAVDDAYDLLKRGGFPITLAVLEHMEPPEPEYGLVVTDLLHNRGSR